MSGNRTESQISALGLSHLEDIAVHHPLVDQLFGIRVTPAMSSCPLMLWPKLFPYRECDLEQQSVRPLAQAESRRDYGPAGLLVAPQHMAEDQST